MAARLCGRNCFWQRRRRAIRYVARRRAPTNRCTRAGPASFSSRACVFRRCVRPRELNRYATSQTMGRVQQTAGLIKQGRNPVEIATEFGVTLDTVLGYLDRAVGDGALRRSDIYFSFTPEQRATNWGYLESYAGSRHALGDMYEDVRRIELKLHTIIRSTLTSEFGDNELWWREGVPQAI